jgi:hypothetical protein
MHDLVPRGEGVRDNHTGPGRGRTETDVGNRGTFRLGLGAVCHTVSPDVLQTGVSPSQLGPRWTSPGRVLLASAGGASFRLRATFAGH